MYVHSGVATRRIYLGDRVRKKEKKISKQIALKN